MGTRTIGSLCALLFAALLAFVCWPAPDPTPAAAIPADAADSIAAPHPAEAPIAADPERHETNDAAHWFDDLSAQEEILQADDSDPHAVVLRGRLTVRQRAWVHPAGVTIRLTRSLLDTVLPADAGEQDELAPSRDDPTATTDDEGRFAFRFAPVTGELFFLIDHLGEWMDFQRVADVPRPGGDLDLGDVFVDDRGGVEGQVVDADGRPAAEVTIRAIDDPLLGAGSELGELRAARNASAERFQVPGALAVGPIPAWVVRRDRFLPFPKTTTDLHGRFRLNGLRPGGHDLYLQAEAGTTRVANVHVACLRCTDVGTVTLGRTRSMSFDFIDETDAPWVGAGVAFLDAELGFGPIAVRTDAFGKARAWVAADSTCRIAFGYPGGGPWMLLRTSQQGGTVRVPRAQPLTIRLVASGGGTIRGGRVRTLVQGDAFRPVDRYLPAGMQPREREPGVYVGRAPCFVVAVASAPGYAPAIASVPLAGDVTLVMLPLATVTVRVRDHDHQSIAGAAVRIQAHEHPDHTFPGSSWALLANDRVLAGRTDENGALAVPVWDTWLSFAADHPDFALSAGPRLRPVPGQWIDLLLRKNGTIRGRLTFQRRDAPAGFRVRARMRPPPAHELADSGWLGEELAVTGEGGVFAFRNLDAGIWELWPELPSAPRVAGPAIARKTRQSRQVALDEGQKLHCDLEAEWSALEGPQIAGTVTIDGVQLGGALVRVRMQESESKRRSRRETREQWQAHAKELRARIGEPVPPEDVEVWEQRLSTDAFGDFAFAGLGPTANYVVRIDAPFQGRLQYLHRTVVSTPGRGSTKPSRLAIELQSGSLDLTWTRHDRPFANRMVRLRQVGPEGDDLARFELLTTARGECIVDRLPVGTWTIEAVHGGDCEPDRFTLEPGGVVVKAVRVLGP